MMQIETTQDYLFFIYQKYHGGLYCHNAFCDGLGNDCPDGVAASIFAYTSLRRHDCC